MYLSVYGTVSKLKILKRKQVLTDYSEKHLFNVRQNKKKRKDGACQQKEKHTAVNSAALYDAVAWMERLHAKNMIISLKKSVKQLKFHLSRPLAEGWAHI